MTTRTLYVRVAWSLLLLAGVPAHGTPSFTAASLRRNCPEAESRFSDWVQSEARSRPEAQRANLALLTELSGLCPSDDRIEETRAHLERHAKSDEPASGPRTDAEISADLQRALELHATGEGAAARLLLEKLYEGNRAARPEIIFHLAGVVFGDGDEKQAATYLEELVDYADRLSPEQLRMAQLYLSRARAVAGLAPATREPGFDRVDTRRFSFSWDASAKTTRSRSTQRRIEDFLEQAYWEVGADLDRSYPDRAIPVIFYSPEVFRKRYPSLGNFAGFWDGGAIRINTHEINTEGMKELLFHEYTHVLVEHLARGRKVPSWLNEGLAEVEERRANMRLTQALAPSRRELLNLAHETRRGVHPPLRTFEKHSLGSVRGGDALRRTYSRAYIAVAHLGDCVGIPGVMRIIRGIGSGESFEESFRSVYPGGPQQFETDFERHVLQQD